MDDRLLAPVPGAGVAVEIGPDAGARVIGDRLRLPRRRIGIGDLRDAVGIDEEGRTRRRLEADLVSRDAGRADGVVRAVGMIRRVRQQIELGPGVEEGELLVPSVELAGMIEPVTFRVRRATRRAG